MNKELQSRAILLRSYNLSETSLIIHWLSEDYGLLKSVAKGAKSKQSKFTGTLELYSICEIQLLHSSKSELHSLLSCLPITHFPGLRKDYSRLTLASYFGSLLEQGLDLEQPAPELYNLFHRALGYTNQNPLEWKAVTYFEKELSRMLGYSYSGDEVRKISQASPKIKELRERVKQQLNN